MMDVSCSQTELEPRTLPEIREEMHRSAMNTHNSSFIKTYVYVYIYIYIYI